jgi:hypothetical protein
MIKKLKAQRKKHADALRAVDAIFESIGISTHLAEERPRRGRPPGKRGRRPGRPSGSGTAGATPKPGRGRRGRRKFATTGTESIIKFVKEGGKSGRTTAEINKQWKSEGRSGNAYVTIGHLVKARKLKRKNMPGERGSRYTASGSQ